MLLPVLIFFGVYVFTSLAYALESPLIPERQSFDRYAYLLEKSPFAQAAPLQEATPKENFTKNFVLVSHYRVGGVLYVNLMQRDDQTRVVATSTGDLASGIKVVSLTEADSPWQVKAVIELNGEEGTVAFDPPTFAPSEAIASANPASEPVRRTRVRNRDDD